MSVEVEKKYGKILFGEQRRKKELNTAKENEAFENIESYLGGEYGPSTTDGAKKVLKEFLKLKTHSNYKSVLMPESYDYVYRGIGFAVVYEKKKAVEFAKTIKITEKNYETYAFVSGQNFKNSYVYKPIYEIESWTTSYTIAKEFAEQNGDYSFIFKAAIPKKDMLFNTSFSNMVSMSLHDVKEYEIIRISKNPVNCKIQTIMKPKPWAKFLIKNDLI